MLLCACALLFAVPIFSSCSTFHIKNIPNPLADDLGYGQVITEIQISGNEHTKERVVTEAMQSKVGDVYTEKSADLDARRLYQLGVFTMVRFNTLQGDSGMVLTVELSEVNPYIPAPSIKITEENGLEVGAMISSANLFGLAARLSAWVRVGGATNIGARYRDPWLPGKYWILRAITAEYFHVERWNPNFEFDESSNEVNFNISANITNYLRWGPRGTYLGIGSDQPNITLDPDNQDNILGAGAFVQYDTRNLQTYPTNGWWIEYLLMRHREMNTKSAYWQSNLDLRRYFQFGSDRHSLALYSLLTTTSGTVGVDYPIYLQYVLGGANTVRGWNLGAREGKNQFLNTIEYWWLVLEPKSYEFWFLKQALGLQVATFVDGGAAWSEGSVFDQSWIAGGGVGLRVTIPSMVMFRLDFAYGQSGINIQLAIGSDEKATAQRARIR